MRVVIIDNGSKYLPVLENIFADKQVSVYAYDKFNMTSLRSNDLVVLSGGHMSPVLWHNKVFAKEIELIRIHRGPIIGICLGFELITHVFGSHLHLMKQRRKGLVNVWPVKENELLADTTIVKVYENHNWAVQKVKQPLVSLVESEDGIEVLKHSTRPIYGLQFHPEADLRVGGQRIFKKIIESVS